MATVMVPASTRRAPAAPKSFDIGYKISCRRCGYVHCERVAKLSESLKRQCPTGCGAIVRIAAYLLSPAFAPPHQEEFFDLLLWHPEAEREDAVRASNRPHRRSRRKTPLDCTGS